MTKAKLRLLILSAGCLAAQSIIAALGARREHCVLIGANSVAESAGNFCCDVAYLVPPADSGSPYIEHIAELIREERPHLVIPSRDDDVLALAMLAERSLGGDAVLLTGTAATARVMHDKLESARFATRHGLPFAATAADAREAIDLARAHGLPLIGKPRTGNGSRGVVLLRSFAEIERAFELRPDLIAQPFLDPPPDMAALIAPYEAGLPFFFSFPESGQYAVEVVVGPDGAVSSAFSNLCTMVGGQPVRSERPKDADVLEVGRAYALAAAREGWRGPINIQLKRTPDGRFVAYELNGRFSGGTIARTMMGFDETGDVIRRFLPWADFPHIEGPHADAVQSYLRGFPVPRGGVEALRSCGRWARTV